MSPCRKSANIWPHVLTAGLWLWKWGELFSRNSAPIFFPVFSYPFLDRFFTYTHADFNGEHISYLIETNWPKTSGNIIDSAWIPIQHDLDPHTLNPPSGAAASDQRCGPAAQPAHHLCGQREGEAQPGPGRLLWYAPRPPRPHRQPAPPGGLEGGKVCHGSQSRDGKDFIPVSFCVVKVLSRKFDSTGLRYSTVTPGNSVCIYLASY
jgi:hypothetical protein